MNYYNDNSAEACAWIAELIAQKLIPDGKIDQRSILDVRPDDLSGFAQCHWFAGILGWPLALQLAGIPEDYPIWTGSCPCQPFSIAGAGKGTDDERHLWPAFFALIAACRPPLIFGEQVASPAVIGRVAKSSKRRLGSEIEQVWLDGVFSDLEGARYACAAANIPVAGIGAPHIRQRLWWVAKSNGCFTSDGELQRGRELRQQSEDGRTRDGMAHPERNGRRTDEPRWEPEGRVVDGRISGVGQADTIKPRLEGYARHGDNGNQPGRNGANETGSTSESGSAYERMDHPSISRCDGTKQDPEAEARHEARMRMPDAGRGFDPWGDFDIIACRDGKHRRIPRQPRLAQPEICGLVTRILPGVDASGSESDSFPLSTTKEARTGLLRGFGNSICPQLAAEFISAYFDTLK